MLDNSPRRLAEADTHAVVCIHEAEAMVRPISSFSLNRARAAPTSVYSIRLLMVDSCLRLSGVATELVRRPTTWWPVAFARIGRCWPAAMRRATSSGNAGDRNESLKVGTFIRLLVPHATPRHSDGSEKTRSSSARRTLLLWVISCSLCSPPLLWNSALPRTTNTILRIRTAVRRFLTMPVGAFATAEMRHESSPSVQRRLSPQRSNFRILSASMLIGTAIPRCTSRARIRLSNRRGIPIAERTIA
jgi:hypothetical protein